MSTRRALGEAAGSHLRRRVGAYLAFQTFAHTNFASAIFVVFYQRFGGLDLSEILILSSFYTGVRVLFEVPLGLAADRFGRRLSMAAGSVAMAMGCVAMVSGAGLPSFYLAEAAFAFAVAARSGADSAFLYDTLAEYGQQADYPRVEGRAQALGAIAMGASALVSGVLLSVWLPLPFIALLITSTAAVVCAALLDEPRRARPSDDARPLRRAVGEVVGSPALLWLVGLFSFLVVTSHVVFYLQQPFLEGIGVPVAAFGLVLAATKLVSAVCAAGAHRIQARVSAGRLPPLMMAVALAPIGLMGLAGSLLGAPVVLLRGVVDGLLQPLVGYQINRLTHPVSRAGVLSLATFVARATQALMLVGVAWSLEVVSLSTVLLGAFLVGGLVAIGLTALRVAMPPLPPARVARLEMEEGGPRERPRIDG